MTTASTAHSVENRSAAELTEGVERLRAELNKAESRIADAQRIAHLGYWEADLRTKRDWWSGEYYRMLGMSPGQVEPTFERFIQLVHPEDRDAIHRAHTECLARSGPCEVTYRVILPDAARRFFHTRAEVEFDANGNPVRVFGTTLDVTELKDLQQALTESETKWRSVFEQAPLGIVLTGEDRRMRAANPAWIRMTGYSAQELAIMTCSDITHPDDLRESMDVGERVQRGGLDTFRLEKRYVRKSGEVFWGRTTGTVVCPRVTGGVHRIVMIEDITKHKESELRGAEQDRQQRNALVREVHHRIKNNLQGIAGLLERHAAANPVLEPAINEALARLNTLSMIHGLQSEHAGRELNLCNIVSGVVESLQMLSSVPLDFKIPYGFIPAQITADESVPVALILNEIMSNAIKHVGAGARQPVITIRISRSIEGAVVVVRNSPASLPRGFDFASGKGLGTGLGLAKTLLPTEGARLSISEPVSGIVETVLRLSSPALVAAEDA